MRITLDGVTVRFDERVILDDISLDLTEHRIGVIGANGSGKSTLIRLINGLVTPSSGTVVVDRMDVRRFGARVREQVGFVFTNPDSQIVMPTVREDVAFSLRRSGLNRAEQATRVENMLHRFGLAEIADQSAHLLSGGQKQLLALAAILVKRPALVIADEPTTLLDARHARLIADTFAQLDEQLIVATHQLDTLRSFDRVIVVDHGTIVADDSPAAAITTYRALVGA